MVSPRLEKVLVEQVVVECGVLRITARTRDEVVLPCPDCGTVSGRVHSRYQRHLADAAVGGRPVVIELSVRRLFCDAADCPRRTFAEQVEGLTIRYGRYTSLLLELLRAVGLALAGSAEARLMAVLNVVVSRMTLLSPCSRCPSRRWSVRGFWASTSSRSNGPAAMAWCWSMWRPTGSSMSSPTTPATRLLPGSWRTRVPR